MKLSSNAIALPLLGIIMGCAAHSSPINTPTNVVAQPKPEIIISESQPVIQNRLVAQRDNKDHSAEYEVTVAVEAPQLTRGLVADLEKKAKVEALKKYLLRLDSNMGQDFIRKATAEVDKFVEDIDKKDDRWTNLAPNMGQLQGSFVVELRLEEINQWLKEVGFKTQGKIELTIMEEPPSLGTIQLSEEYEKKFLNLYTNFQRRIRDCIIKKVDEFGFDVNLLADNDLYDEYKDKDGELVGVFYDSEIKNFTRNMQLMRAVQANNPDTLVLYYRIETLEYDEANKQIRVTVAFGLKHLLSNVTKSFGTADYSLISHANTLGILADDIGKAAELAINKLMNSEGSGSRLNRLAMELKNAANQPAGSVKVSFNGEVIDAKIRKKIMYQFKKQLVDKGIVAAPTDIKSSNTTMTFETKPEFNDPESLYMEHISPILEELGAEIDDDKVNYKKGMLIIKP